jgi:hypothetical protein
VQQIHRMSSGQSAKLIKIDVQNSHIGVHFAALAMEGLS